MSLSAVVIGTGWAGEGHTIALQTAGVEVIALCGRDRSRVNARARCLGIANARTSWRDALLEFHPDIVAIAVPAALHTEIVEVAVRMRSATVCEKPLAACAEDARSMLATVDRGKIKHAYAATSRYSPAVAYARSLVGQGLIGAVREIESMTCMPISPLLAYAGWIHEIGEGGGFLNQAFPHKIEQVLRITGAMPLSAGGETRRLVDLAPVAKPFHDFREIFSPCAIVDPEQARAGAWRAVTADSGFTVVVRLTMPGGPDATALFHASALPRPDRDYLALYGSEGALRLTGPNSPDHLEHFSRACGSWVDLPIPREIWESLPAVEDPTQRDWNQLYREFVADVRGSGGGDYPTFRDGVVASEIMEIARKGQAMTPLASGS